MSRFFKRTNALEDNRVNEAEVLDLDRMMNVVKEKVGRQLALESSQDVTVPLVTQFPSNGNRLEEALPVREAERRIALPRHHATLLLAADELSSPAAVEAFERLRHRLMRHQERIPARSRCVVVTSADACEGKTLVTANLALSCAKVHKTRVLLVDADLRSQGLSELLGPLPAPGLAEVLAGAADYEAAVVQTNIPFLHVVGAGTVESSTAELLSGEACKDFIAWSTQNYDLVLVDSPPILRVADYDLIAAVASGILFVVRARRTKCEGLERVLNHVEASKLVGIVFNGAEERERRDYYNRYYRCGGPHSYQG